MGLGKLDKFKSESKDSKKKSSVVEIQEPSLDNTCDELIKASKNLKNAEAALEQAQAEIIEFLFPKQMEALKKSDLTKSFRLNDKVLCLFTERFKDINKDDREEIEKRLNQANISIEKLFAEKLNLKLKKEVEDNYPKLEKLLELLGENILKEYFDYNVRFVPVDDFYKALIKENAVDIFQDIIENIRYKPTVKVG